jgi:hypothetical protein
VSLPEIALALGIPPAEAQRLLARARLADAKPEDFDAL